MNAPVEKVLFLLRPDLSLQFSVGDHAVDVNLSPADAYSLAVLLLANLQGLKPWLGHREGDLIEVVHSFAFVGAEMAQALQESPESLPEGTRTMVADALLVATRGLYALNDVLEKRKSHADNHNAATPNANALSAALKH